MSYLQHQLDTLTKEGRVNRHRMQCLISAGDVATIRAIVRVKWEERFQEMLHAPIEMTGREGKWVDDLIQKLKANGVIDDTPLMPAEIQQLEKWMYETDH